METAERKRTKAVPGEIIENPLNLTAFKDRLERVHWATGRGVYQQDLEKLARTRIEKGSDPVLRYPLTVNTQSIKDAAKGLGFKIKVARENDEFWLVRIVEAAE